MAQPISTDTTRTINVNFQPYNPANPPGPKPEAISLAPNLYDWEARKAAYILRTVTIVMQLFVAFMGLAAIDRGGKDAEGTVPYKLMGGSVAVFSAQRFAWCYGGGTLRVKHRIRHFKDDVKLSVSDQYEADDNPSGRNRTRFEANRKRAYSMCYLQILYLVFGVTIITMQSTASVLFFAGLDKDKGGDTVKAVYLLFDVWILGISILVCDNAFNSIYFCRFPIPENPTEVTVTPAVLPGPGGLGAPAVTIRPPLADNGVMPWLQALGQLLPCAK